MTYWSGLPRSDFSPPITKTRLYWLPGNILGSTIAVLGCSSDHKYQTTISCYSNWINTLAVWRNLGYLSCPTNLHLENLNFWNNFKYWISTIGRLLEKIVPEGIFCGFKIAGFQLADELAFFRILTGCWTVYRPKLSKSRHNYWNTQ